MSEEIRLRLPDGRKPRVAFVCVHNSCRSQIAEAFAQCYDKIFESYSAGTEIGNVKINKDAIRLMGELYDIDLSEQQPKHIDTLPDIDVVITMGCNVECPFLPCQHREDWGLDDPSGKDDDFFIDIIRGIEAKVASLRNRIKRTGDNGAIPF